MHIIKKTFLSLFLIVFLFSTPVSSKKNIENEYSYLKELNENPYENYTDIPFVLKNKFSYEIYLDRYLQIVINDLRKVASDKKNLTQSDINALKDQKITEERKKQLLELTNFDTNFDQKVSKEEIISVLSENSNAYNNNQKFVETKADEIMRTDTNNDGAISHDEMSNLSPQKQRLHDNEFRQYQDLIKLDQNNDEILSDKELEVLALKSFAAVDKNNDKQISVEEYQLMNKENPLDTFQPEGGAFGNECNIQGDFKDMKVYAVDAASSKELDFQIDYSGSPTMVVDLSVNIPDSNVALILLGHFPTVWNLAINPSTKIKAVFLGGFGTQNIADLDNSTPVLNNQLRVTENGLKPNLPCGREILVGWGLSPVRELSQHLFKNDDVTIIKTNGQGQASIGEKTTSLTFQKYETLKTSYKLKDSFSPSVKGLEEAEIAGVIRKATEKDLEQWIDILEENKRNNEDQIPIYGKTLRDTLQKFVLTPNTYVILKDFVYPIGFTGVDAVNFIIPKGITPPKGLSAPASVYDMNTASCSGPLSKC